MSNPLYKSEKALLLDILAEMKNIREVLTLALCGPPVRYETASNNYFMDKVNWEPDLDKCPQCGGIADNGNDRCVPPNPYPCVQCADGGTSSAPGERDHNLDDAGRPTD